MRAQKTPPAQDTAVGPNGEWTRFEAEAMSLFIQLGRMAGLPKSFAEVYGVLFISTRPMPVEDLAERLSTSKPAIHRALRFLRRAGLLRLAYVPGDRRVCYEAVAELRHLLIGFVRHQMMPQLEDAQARIDRLARLVQELPKDQSKQLGARIALVQRWSGKSRKMGPLILKLLGDGQQRMVRN